MRRPSHDIGAAETAVADRRSVPDRPRRGRACSPTREFIEVRFGGSGGQGVILMGVILAMAATRDHRYVVQTQIVRARGPRRLQPQRRDHLGSPHRLP